MDNIDTLLWTMGIYAMRGVSTSIGGVLHGRKSKLKYFERPLRESFDQKKQAIKDEEEYYEEHGKTLEFEKFKVYAAVMNANIDRRQSE